MSADGSDVQGEGGTNQVPPTCPRHPDKVSYVRCQRCGSPTCPECQRTAAVGVHCITCVANNAKLIPTPKTAYGGHLAADGSTPKPVVTFTLIGVCLVMFLWQQWGGSAATSAVLFYSPYGLEYEPWRVLTSGFAHHGLMHFGFNMYAVGMAGQILETALGRWRFLALYLASMLAGTGLFALMVPEGAAVGASGAVFGLFVALLVIGRKMGLQMNQLMVLLVLNVILGFVVPDIAWQAHLGGAVGGLIIAGAVTSVTVVRRKLWAYLAVAGAVGVAGLVLVQMGAQAVVG